MNEQFILAIDKLLYVCYNAFLPSSVGDKERGNGDRKEVS